MKFPPRSQDPANGHEPLVRKRKKEKIMTFETVRDTLAKQFDIDPSEITMDTNLIDDIGADSLDVVELIMALEDEYGVTISDDDAANLTSVRKIVEYVEQLQ